MLDNYYTFFQYIFKTEIFSGREGGNERASASDRGIIALSQTRRTKREREHRRTNEALSLFADADSGRSHANVSKNL